MENQDHKIIPHNTERYGVIRTTMISNRLWYVAADIARGMNLTNTTVSMMKVSDRNKRKVPLFTNGRYYPMNILNHDGVLELLTGIKLKSDDFKNFMLKEFLPAIEPENPDDACATSAPADSPDNGAADFENDSYDDDSDDAPDDSENDALYNGAKNAEIFAETKGGGKFASIRRAYFLEPGVREDSFYAD